jgi:hypothetical protein
MKNKKIVPQNKIEKNKENETIPLSISRFIRRILFLLVALVIIVGFIDQKGYFNADQKNNHIRKKWASFYNFTKTKEVDVLILGNSHIITGIDPFVLSNATSSNCFILGNSGTGVIDAWFQLGEALKYTKPKLVILETYCINNGEKPEKDVIPYLQSFDAQTNVSHKLMCMPQIFKIDNWLEAWSTSIRNHSFLLTDTARINYNIKNPKETIPRQLNLGRFARFSYGLQDSTLKKYDVLGAPVKGKDYKMSTFTKKYLQKIIEMCDERNIPVLFLTVPMYYKHIDNYPIWKTTLNKELEKYPKAKWLDLQMPYDTLIYKPEMFENSYAQNQHLTNNGMIATAYKVATYIDKKYPNLLPDRSQQLGWISDFMYTPHFWFNQDIPINLSGFYSILKDKKVNNFYVRELGMQNSKKSNLLILKIDRKAKLPNELTVQYKIEVQGKLIIADVKMYKIKEIHPPKHEVFVNNLLKEVIVKEIVSIKY